MFNARNLIVRSDQAKSEIMKHPEFILKKKFEPYELYELQGNEDGYVKPLKNLPVLYETKNWKLISYRWFKINTSDVHIAFTAKIDENDLKRFKTIVKSEKLSPLPEIPVDASCNVTEDIKQEEIVIKTGCINKPLLIKISYHPNWKVEGADKVYLVSPSFMLIFPNSENVRLRFSKNGAGYAGNLLTAIALFMITLNLPWLREGGVMKKLMESINHVFYFLRSCLMGNVLYINIFNTINRKRISVIILIWVLLLVLLSIFILVSKKEDPVIIHKKGFQYLQQKNYNKARDYFKATIQESPESHSAIHSSFYYALSYFQEGNYQKSIDAFNELIRSYPESTWVPEAYYHIGLANASLNKPEKARESYNFVISNYPTSTWAKHSHERLRALTRP